MSQPQAWLLADDWTMLASTSLSFPVKWKQLCERFIKLGLMHPQKRVSTSIVAIAMDAAGEQVGKQEAYTNLQLFKSHMKALTRHLAPKAPLPMSFDMDPKDFQEVPKLLGSRLRRLCPRWLQE